MSDIQRMSGTFNSPEAKGENYVLTGTAPVSEMGNYTKEVMQYTHGRGRLSCSLKGYEPCHNSDEVIAQIGYDCDADVDNPCGSVFCSHGAGYNVPWNEVGEHMHLPSILDAPKDDEIGTNSENAFAKCKTQDDIFALDKELMQIFEQTYGPVTRRKHAPEKRHVKAVSSIDKAAEKYRKSPVYDGTEYLLVDGYNVIFAWEHLKELSERSLDGARHALINILCNYQGYSKCNLILVFECVGCYNTHLVGFGKLVRGFLNKHIGGFCLFGIYNADIIHGFNLSVFALYLVRIKHENKVTLTVALIVAEKTSHKLAKTNKVRVVTSDALEQMIILGNGALRVSSRAFLEEVRQAENEIREIINSSNELNNNMN